MKKVGTTVFLRSLSICVKNNKQPLITGEDGKAVLEVIFAAYESAGLGKKVMLPFKSDVDKPYKLWKK